MSTRNALWFSSWLCGAVLVAACPGPSQPSGNDPSQVVIDAIALDPTHIRVSFAIDSDLASGAASDPRNYEVANFLVDPPASLTIASVVAEPRAVVLTTSPMEALATYTLKVKNLVNTSGVLVADQATANLVGVGDVARVPVTFRVDASLHVPLVAPSLKLTVNPDTGVFSEQLRTVPLGDPDGDKIFEAVVQVAIDPRRTVDTLDDHLGADHIAYAARVQSGGVPASDLTFFEVVASSPVEVPLALTTPLANGGVDPEVCDNATDDDEDGATDCDDDDCAGSPDCEVENEVPLLASPIDPIPGDGFAVVRFAIDDRAARALRTPAVRLSLNNQGFFDADFPRVVNVARFQGSDIYFVDLNVKVDPSRTLNGTSESTFPYVVFLRESGEDFEGITKNFVVPNETPQVVNLRVGNPNLVPVTFRVDVSGAFLNVDGSLRGVFPEESVFLTGEFSLAEDAFGRNAADAFSGGENPVLQMVERTDVPGVWEKTIFLPANRPFGWKVVRCPTDEGCADLNQFVASAGRAFPTVMKNLVTENEDASGAASTAVIINPKELDAVTLENGTVHDYSNALVFDGERGDPTPPAPADNVMFKQEVPDLVAIVGEDPVKTPIFIVGTWRDINLPFTPQEIIQNGTTVNLTDFDYDDGFIGFFPPVRPDDLPVGGVEICDNGTDDDSDTATDCGDIDCAADPSCQVAIELCNNSLDDDGDGDIDCGDDDCSGNAACLVSACPENPTPPQVLNFVLDGALDANAAVLAGGVNSVRLVAAFSADGKLYVATEDAGEGSDHFFFVSATAPGSSVRPAPFAKAGTVAAGSGDLLFLADENDNNFSGWFRSNPVGGDTLLSGNDFLSATPANNGGVLEGVINLGPAFGQLPTELFLSAAVYASQDGGALIPAAQTPAGDGDGIIDANEFIHVCLPGLEVVQ